MNHEPPQTLVQFLRQLKIDGVPKEEYSKRVDDFLGRKAWFDNTPFYGQFELTPFCNLDCKMCYVHLNKNQMNGAKPLTVDQWKDIINQAFDAGMRKATLTGGECLVYPGFDEVYIYLMSLGIKVSVFTNGILLDRDRIEFFKKYPPCEVRVSLYGSDNSVYYRVTGHSKFDVVWNNIMLAKDAKLPIAISITPNRFMEDDAEQLVEKVHSLGIAYAINSHLFEPRVETGRRDDCIDASDETYLQMYKKRKLLNGSTLTKIEINTLPKAKESGEYRRGIECGAGKNGFQISWNGEMFPCTNLRLFSAYPLIEGFKSSWVKLNSLVNELVLPIECHDCPYEKYCGVCVVPHIQSGRTDRCNKLKCQSIKRMVSEGLIEFDQEC